MKKTIYLLAALCVLALAGCGQQSVPAAPSETGKPDAISFSDDQLYAVAWVGYDDLSELPFYLDQYIGGHDVPIHYISDGDFYLVIPKYEDMKLELYENDITTDTSSLVFEAGSSHPFLVQCNISDIFPDVTIALTYQDERVEFSPFISLMDGSLELGERGLNLTK